MLIESMNTLKGILAAAITRAAENKKKPSLIRRISGAERS